MNETTDATATLAPLWKRKWLILGIAILVAAGAYYHYKKAPQTWAEKTQLYLGATSEGQPLLNNTLGRTSLSQTSISDQAELINASISEQVKRKFRREHNPAAAKAKLKAKQVATSDFLQISGEARTPVAVSEALNAVAAAYIAHHQANSEHAVKTAIETTRRQILRIERSELLAKSKSSKGSSGNAVTLQTASLETKLNQLESDLNVAGVQQVGIARPAKAELTGPAPKKNAIFGFVIGLVLATLAVYILSRFNRRLRSLQETEAVFGVPVLAAAPTVRTPIVRREGRVRPSKQLSEPLRRLNSSLALSGVPGQNGAGRGPRSILFLSPEPGDGKSTMAAGLALVQRDGGDRTAIVEADFRRPVMGRLLGLTDGHGLAEVLTGSLPCGAALQEVESVRPPMEEGNQMEPESAAGLATVVRAPGVGQLSVLLGNRAVGNPPALLARPEMAEMLGGLRETYEHVLVDAPSPLQVSDVMPLLRAVDGIVIVARIGHTRLTSARRLVQLLERTASAPVVGVAANAVARSDMRRSGFSSEFGQRGFPLNLFGG